MNPHNMAIAVFLAYFLVRIYFRMRRAIGPQKYARGRLSVSIVLWILALALVVSVNLKFLPKLESILAGIALGAVVAVIALRLTRFEIAEHGFFYTVPGYIGVGIVLLLVGRIAHRILAIYPLLQAIPSSGASPDSALIAAQVNTPITLGLFGLLVGYYLMFYMGILWRARRRQSM